MYKTDIYKALYLISLSTACSIFYLSGEFWAVILIFLCLSFLL